MSFTRYRERSRDVQDGLERHVWGEQKYVPKGGTIVKVRGTDSQDQEAAVLNVGGVNFHLPKDSNTEIMLSSSSSDTNLKMAILTIPRDKQRRWRENTGGIQHHNDPDFALEFNDKHAWITKDKFAVGEKGIFEVKGDKVYIRGTLIVEKEVVANIRVKTPDVQSGTENVPGFQRGGGKEMEEDKDQGQQGGGGGTPAEAEGDGHA